MCCEQAHICKCHSEAVTIRNVSRCIRCGDPLKETELFCIECEEGKQWPAN